MLNSEQIDGFVEQGFVRLEEAVQSEVAAACAEVIWQRLAREGMVEGDPATWKEPLARFPCPDGGPFVAAGTSPSLCSAYDQLLGPRRWRRDEAVGGNVFVRFPSDIDPLQTKWHIDGAFLAGEEWRNNVYCKEKGLLALFLFSETGDKDAPTLLLAGSHFDMAAVLEPHGDEGLSFDEICRQIPPATLEREVVAVTGAPGDVYLCHPLLVHSPSWTHQGRNPRLLAQPGIGLLEPFALNDASAALPVERAIIQGLKGAPSAAIALGWHA